jgi:hypothetical protein
VPCSFLDIGGKLTFNQEGDAGFRNFEAGFLSAMYIPVSLSDSEHNIRFGADFGWGLNRLDFSKLTWSDQLDAKYGVVRATNFGINGINYSKVFFNPGFGISLKSLMNKKSTNAWVLNAGWAGYRLYSVYNSSVNQSTSVTGLNRLGIFRWNGFISSKFVLHQSRNEFMTVEPYVVYQEQGNINYWEMGTRYAYLKNAGIAFAYHKGNFVESNTSWMNYTADFAFNQRNGRRSDLFLTYSHNTSGLSNFVGPQFEVGINFHFQRSTICKWIDRDDEVPYSSTSICPVMTISPGKRKMYDKIW